MGATAALWSMFTYCYPAWSALPYLFLGGPPASGKSRLLDVIERLAFRPVVSSNLTGPALFRTLHAHGGTLLYDEAERLKQTTPDVQELRSMFLAGYRRGGCATRLEPVGGGFRSVQFDVFGPKVLACIAGLPPALATRCIALMMFRSPSDSDKPKRHIDADPDGWQAIRDDLHVLALEHGPTWVDLAARGDVVPAGIAARDYELWQPVLALAAWVDAQGAGGLLDVMRTHAKHAVTAARDDAVPESDEVLLEVLADAVRDGLAPTSGDLLRAARLKDEPTFRMWGAKTVSTRLKTYGIPQPPKVGGQRRYMDVTLDKLQEIAERYGIDLGIAAAKDPETLF